MASMAATSISLRAGVPLFNGQALEGRQLSRDACSCVQPMCLNVEARHKQSRIMPQQQLATHTTLRSVASRHASQISKTRQTVCAAGGLGGEDDSDGNVVEFFDEETFRKHLHDAGDKLVVVDISTKTCGPCKMIYPKFVEMSEEFTDAVFLKIQGDHDAGTRALMRDWKVRSVPSFRFYRNEELIHSHTGAKVDKLREELQKHYASANA
ncbi:hypothetical protein KFL_000460060 [Klebsormidium nitens]|uniref:Thioredoxin domain-containing protein n=1 Tax=Klebsormidium nitens TaxID=105231 RepID=A0A1Y1HN79_KLENI|nr:hypothetical protein KFL_000460060 [Klebsormidium nitens]|eukprot:GAQ80095.1 hypothetical protein KFL_000460060 [Klebsormidium nitens]